MEEKKNDLFRKKSLDRISSPEELDKYVKTASPAVVILFVSIALFFVGLFTWAFVGKIETKSVVGFAVTEEKGSYIATTYITENDYKNFIKGKDNAYIDKIYMKFDDVELHIKNISDPIVATEEKMKQEQDAYLFTVAGIEKDDLYYAITADTNLTKDGRYEGKIVYEKVSPISFLI